MDDKTTKKVIAGAKMAFGVARMCGGVVTGAGHGILGTYLRNHNMTVHAMRFGKASMEGGKRMFDQGLADWKQAQ